MKKLILPAVASVVIALLVTGCASKEKNLVGPSETAANTTAAAKNVQPAGLPAPDPALRRLDKLAGTWSMRGHLVGSEQENIIGQVSFHWLDGGFFMVQDVEMDFAGTTKIKSLELIGYDSESRTLTSSVYSNQSPVPIPCSWDVQGSNLTITLSRGALNATFTGILSEDGQSFSGGWRPNPGADEKINVPYDIGATRVK
jgi:hypothetical protein